MSPQYNFNMAFIKKIHSVPGHQGAFNTLALLQQDPSYYDQYEEITDLELQKLEKKWRDEELKNTDWVIAVTDHPKRADYLTYRQSLRDWPSTEFFPFTKPAL